MAWIEKNTDVEPGTRLAALFDELRAADGSDNEVMRIQGLNPEAAAACILLYRQLQLGSSGLTRADREAIAVVVSASNNSTYCVSRHAEALARFEVDNTRLKQILSGFRFLDMSDRSARMLSYAAKLTATPAAIRSQDIARLREVGFTDRDILDINLLAGFFNFLNRVALGLGITLDPDQQTTVAGNER